MSKGRFGKFGGQFVPETLMPALAELEEAFENAQRDDEFQCEFDELLKKFVGRPTPLYFAKRLTELCGGAKIYLKREDLAHTGAHKINNALGQGLLAKRMNKTRIVAETGAGQHGVATAATCAMLGLECVVYMGTDDIKRQQLNVFRMQLLGAQVREVNAGSRTLKDAINEALRDWVTNVHTTYYLLGSALGPHPYPTMVREFQSVIGREAKLQLMDAEGKLPTALIACVGGGSNSIGLFDAFRDEDVEMIGVEAGGRGIGSGKHAARFAEHGVGVLHGTCTYLLQTEDGQVRETHSVSAGLDYPAVGPEHAHLFESERVGYVYATDDEALDAFRKISHYEGIIPALESAHAVAEVLKRAPKMQREDVVIVNLSGRGDKDLQTVMNASGKDSTADSQQ